MTPHIERLATEGMRFTAAHSPASLCTPSRYNLITGRYCWRAATPEYRRTQMPQWGGDKTTPADESFLGHRVPFIVRWPGRVKAGSQSGQLLALTDLMATFVELTGRALPAEAGEDSFSFLPTLLDTRATQPARTSLVTDSMTEASSPFKKARGSSSPAQTAVANTPKNRQHPFRPALPSRR